MTNDPDPRLLNAIRQLDQERHARLKAEQRERALRLANARLKAVVRRHLTADRAANQEKPAVKPPA
jgi:hypothetical protein